jgi:RNA polymerase sigma factor (TIGR02999 family)
VRSRGDVTGLLLAWSAGDLDAHAALVSAVYEDLRRQARAFLRREPAGRALTPTALVHEAYLRLINQQRVQWRNRSHFYAIAAQAMRRVLVDHARARLADKRGGGAAAVALDGIDPISPPPDMDVLMLDAALDRLAKLEPRQVRLVELRYFGGLSIDEAADALDISVATAKRDWTAARAWLYRELRGGRR